MKNSKGYSLIELSVVITIIGIVAGGIFIAQSLIRSSQLNRMLSEYDTYVKALNEFQDKFLAYPGDMKNATDMWGIDPDGCAPTAYNDVPKIATCNGNGDGKIGSSTAGGILSDQEEWFRAWQQLANAGMMNWQFTGTRGAAGASDAVPLRNVPGSAVANAGWTVHYYQFPVAVGGPLWADQYSHMIDFGATTPGNRTIGPIFTPSEALAMDLKIDDGKPGTGILRAWRTSVLPGCTFNDALTQADQTYVVGGTANVCSFTYLLGW